MSILYLISSSYMQDTKEGKEPQVVVTDEASVMGELLRFVYTDQCRGGSTEEVAKLMAAADKYDIG